MHTTTDPSTINNHWVDNMPPQAITNTQYFTSNELTYVVKLLIATVAPVKIYRMDTGVAMDENTDVHIDLLIIMPANNGTAYTELEPLAAFTCMKTPRITCSLHQDIHVAECLQRGHIFYSLHCRPELLIYDQPGSPPLAATPAEILAEVKHDAYRRFERCYERAVHFYNSARMLLHSGGSDLIPFLLQQSIELTLRAVLLCLNGYGKKSHDLPVLIKQVRRVTPALYTFFDLNNEQDQRIIRLLNCAYAACRYDDQYTIGPEDIQLLMNRAELFLPLAMSVVKKLVC